MSDSDRSSAPKSRVNYLRRRPRPGSLVRAPEDLPLPHERDQTDQAMTDGEVTPEGQQAQRDLERGLQDTSKSPEMNKTYQRQK